MAANTRNAELSAERMRRMRERRRKGLVWLDIELRGDEIGELVRRGYLKPDHRDDHGEVRQALYRFFAKQL